MTQQHKCGRVKVYQRCSRFKERCLASISYKWITECSLAYVTCFSFSFSAALLFVAEAKDFVLGLEHGKNVSIILPSLAGVVLKRHWSLFYFGPPPPFLAPSSSSPSPSYSPFFYSFTESKSTGLVRQFQSLNQQAL